jgi:hypothetical protein
MLEQLRALVLICLGGFTALSCVSASAQCDGHFGGYYGILTSEYPGDPSNAPFDFLLTYSYGNPSGLYGTPVVPTAYVERNNRQAPPQVPSQALPEAPSQTPPQSTQSSPASFRYYCPESNAYYPDVKQCPSPWLKALLQPPSNGR